MPDDSFSILSRRQFLADASRTLVAASLATRAASGGTAFAADSKPIALPPIAAPTEQQAGPPPAPLPPGERVGFAVVGLGHLALNQILPAFAESKKAKLTALVSGSPGKAAEVARQYGVPAASIYDYKTFDKLSDNPDVQAIYIVLPNGMHEEFTIRGAQAGKHILTEKPMATSPVECERMIAACDKAGRRLMVAYRIQYEPMNRLVQKWAREKEFRTVKFIESVNGQLQGDPNQWRFKKALSGGGSLPDVGLYCLNTTRFLLGEEPEEVFATAYSNPGDPRFIEVEESVTFQMRFPSGALANCASSYGFHESRRYRAYADTGWYGMDPAFSYDSLRMETSHADGRIEHREQPSIEPKNQFALEMDHMAERVLDGKRPYTPGEEGLQDHRIMAAIYESAASGKPVKLPPASAKPGELDVFRGTAPTAS